LPLDVYLFKIKFPRRPVLDFMLYRNAKRIEWKEKQYCQLHRDYCSILVQSDKVPEFLPITRCSREYRTKEEMILDIYGEIVSWYYVRDANLHRRQIAHWGDFVNFYRDAYTSVSQIALKPITNHVNNPMQTFVEVPEYMRAIIRRVTEFYFRRAYGLVSIDCKVGSLKELCLKRLAWDKIIYEKVAECEQVIFTTNDVSPAKLTRLYREFNVDGAMRGSSFAIIRHLVGPALRRLESSLQCDSRVGTMKFQYSPKNLFEYIKTGTSGGILRGASSSVEIDGTPIKLKNSGEKYFHIEASMREFHRFIINTSKGIFYYFLPLCVNKLKQEFRFLYAKKTEEMPMAEKKTREFFIPDVLMVFLSTLLFALRMIFERGDVIRIGMKNWHGGAWELAKFMNYDNDDLFWVDGDIEGLDKKIKDWQLYLYIISGSRYYDWKNMNRSQAQMVRYLIKVLAYHISNKVVLHAGGFWRFMRGIMYSGGKETSHGDSWIMALIFNMYIQWIITRYPYLAGLLNELMDKGFLRICVYGDDHIWCCPKSLRHIVNVNSWAYFLDSVCDMILRDYKEYDSFVSIPNLQTGGLSYVGPKFLKRYFIENKVDDTLPPILPYKPVFESMMKMFTSPETYPEIYVLKAIGAAWDFMGTNPLGHDMVSFFL